MEAKVTNEVLTVEGIGELTAANVHLFRNQIGTHLNGYSTIEIDLSGTAFIDCTGLGALIALRNLARARNGAVRLVNPTPTVQRLFDVVRAEHLFEIVNSRSTDRPQAIAQNGKQSAEFARGGGAAGETPPGLTAVMGRARASV